MKEKLLIVTLIIISHSVVGQKMYGAQPKTVIPKFSIELSASTDAKSQYYYKLVEGRLKKLDTTVTAEQLISYTRYKVLTTKLNPGQLDDLASELYQLNEEKKYKQAVTKARELLALSANNITGHKELSLAYKKLGNDSLAQLHFGMMVKIISSVFKYGDGRYEHPFMINNFFEGLSIYEAAFRCKPNKTVVMLDKHKRLLGAYNGYSSAMDEILIRYSELSHWKPLLTDGDYIIEGD
jgi:tetratricopeptide (TPR) repeat protein